MTYKQKLTKIGNSVGVIIPAEVLKELGLNHKSDVYLEQVQNGVVIKKTEIEYVSPEVLHVAERVADRYEDAFKELASK
ncbi:AbrB/MazE/SpoVT family DNA-binding domain-containing protein [candidate division WWE3 bacterium]|uniref:AbrB/MazE/SpoVT family DNA-binding domain-containing protein n=1 Tax=candidate division WWE3 bacterium TaxID=2053526 RepID=A0A7X9E7H9_UNCKA|nr:AbrB/MazE/SpoVT family DNA-binding domain-containing protein [candidate division WWE3 bacterium]